jgi:hypothetical protein
MEREHEFFEWGSIGSPPSALRKDTGSYLRFEMIPDTGRIAAFLAFWPLNNCSAG